MSNNLYQVQNLYCRYPSITHKVLEVENLNIKEGEIVFIVGPSGVGKSTILETLGVMNNTIDPTDETLLKFEKGNIKVDFTKLWQKPEKTVADFRKQFMSFIFQNTNLFTSLSVYENIILPAILQGDDYEEAVKKAKSILNSIAKDLKKDKKIAEISEGERQRVAFARAMTTNYSVLFADEPTGNLDLANADRLMTHLKSYLREQENTAIIVTHDIGQAIKYADKVVLINKHYFENSTKTFGFIGENTTFKKDTSKWENISGNGSEWTETELMTYFKKELNAN